MSLSIYAAAGVASFVHIAAKAFQQLNVVHHEVKWVIPISLMLAACEVTIVTMIVKAPDLYNIAALGLGGGCGAILSMNIHKWLRGRRDSV
jgi:hypothetical protein